MLKFCRSLQLKLLLLLIAVGVIFTSDDYNTLTCMLDMTEFDERQFAYLKNRSSDHTVLTLLKLVKAKSVQGKLAGVLFLDYTDAFGSVNRSRLLGKLCRDFGITPTASILE